MGYDGKYGKVTLENKDVPEDEPMFVFRAQDALSTEVIETYAYRLRAMGRADQAEAAYEASNRFQKWQSENLDRVKVPD